MWRLVIENILLFLTPTLLYVGYALLRRHLDDGTQTPDNQPGGQPSASPQPSVSNVLSDAPIIWLALAGAGLVFTVLLLFGSVSTNNPNGTYEPAVFKDGKIVPGRIK
jgi:Family of unknown function (DUF6111)